jgi:hypothetical protein
VVKLLLFRICFRIRLAYTLGNNLLIAFSMAGIFAIRTLHSGSVFQEIPTERTTHNVVELLSDDFVPIHLMDLFFALTDGPLTVESDIKRLSIFHLFCYRTVSDGRNIPNQEIYPHRSS